MLVAWQDDVRRQDDPWSIRCSWNIVNDLFPQFHLSLSHADVVNPRSDAHLTENQFNWLGTIFYLSYLVFEVRAFDSHSILNLNPP